ncbi:MAG: AraC family transcriptional regulator [Chthoniobacterales bacterium]
MERHEPKKHFNFSRLLSPEDQKHLEDTSRWRWISSMEGKMPRGISHPKHAKWIKTKGNTHAPALREIMLTLRGSAVFYFNKQYYMRRPGTVFLLDSHEWRDLKGVAHKNNFSCLWLQLYNRDDIAYNINSYDEKGRHSYQLPVRVKSDKSAALIMDAWDQCKTDPKDKMCRELLRAQIICAILEILGNTESEPVSNHSLVIASVQQYIKDHLGENLSLHSLARIAGYSPFFFHRLFVKHTRQTPVDYVQNARLGKAKELLKRNYTVRAVTETIGFTSPSYFNHFFKKRTRFTPREWRRKEIA